jgi:hypothetical protein
LPPSRPLPGGSLPTFRSGGRAAPPCRVRSHVDLALGAGTGEAMARGLPARPVPASLRARGLRWREGLPSYVEWRAGAWPGWRWRQSGAWILQGIGNVTIRAHNKKWPTVPAVSQRTFWRLPSRATSIRATEALRQMSIQIHEFVLQTSALGNLNSMESAAKLTFSLRNGLTFYVSPSTENFPSTIAGDDGIIGWAVGNLEGGSPAFLALKVNSKVRHGSTP